MKFARSSHSHLQARGLTFLREKEPFSPLRSLSYAKEIGRLVFSGNIRLGGYAILGAVLALQESKESADCCSWE